MAAGDVLFSGARDESRMTALRAARDRALAVGGDRITADLYRFSADAWHFEPS